MTANSVAPQDSVLREASPRGTRARGGDAHAQPGLQAAVLLRHPEAAPVLQRDEGLVGEARAELPEEAALEIGQHAVHVHQHSQGAASRPTRRPAPPCRPRRAAGPPRAPTAQPDHGPRRALAAGTGAMTAGEDTAGLGAGRGARGVRGAHGRARRRGRAGYGRGARGAGGKSAQAPAPERGCGFAALKGNRADRGGPEGRGLEDGPGRWAVPAASAVPGSALAPSPGILRLGSLLQLPQRGWSRPVSQRRLLSP